MIIDIFNPDTIKDFLLKDQAEYVAKLKEEAIKEIEEDDDE